MLAQGEGHMTAEAEDAFYNSNFLQWVFSSADSQLAHAVAVHRSNADIAAVWAPTPEVQRCCEGILRVPDWRPLVKPLILACCVRTRPHEGCIFSIALQACIHTESAHRTSIYAEAVPSSAGAQISMLLNPQPGG